MDDRQLTVKHCLLSNVKKEYAPGPFAGRGGVSWCHLLLPPMAALEGAVTGAHVSLTAFRRTTKVVTTLHKPLREQPAFSMAFTTQGKGEVDFAGSPTISH
jgi:hypothetical protein